METLTKIKEIEFDPTFEKKRIKSLKKLKYKNIDKPIVGLIKQINDLPYCFTIQCCYGHFLYLNRNDSYNVEPLPKSTNIKEVEYRIAYIAVCLQYNEKGHKLFNAMKDIVKINPENIQFGCADWFWNRQVNTFVLQVEPERYKMFDKATLDYEEALIIENVRNKYIKALNTTITDLFENKTNPN